MARSRDEYSGWSEPAINLRTQVFDMAAAGCRAAQELGAGSPIWELARSEQAYTFQRPGEYITSVLAGAIHAGWEGPIFIQGDHYQWNAKNYAKDPDQVTGALHEATLNAMSVGYGNIDIDSSTLVDLSFDSLDEQQKENYTRAAELAALIRENEELTISIGGEIGEVGKANSSPEELRAYLDAIYERGLVETDRRETEQIDREVAQLTDELLYHGDVNAALRRMMQDGLRDRDGEQLKGLRELATPDSYDLRPYAGFEVKDEDFTFAAVNLNLVYRWEYRPGSTIFLVWTHAKERYEEGFDQADPAQSNRGFDAGYPFRTEPANTFTAKISYWFSI